MSPRPNKQPTDLSTARHSLAHILAMAVLERDPKAKLGIGPATDEGFYYDFELSRPLSSDELPSLEARMRELLKSGLTFKKEELSPLTAREIFEEQPYKLELIDDFVGRGEKITTYTSGTFTDLCHGPHVSNTKDIDPASFSLDRIAGAYWKGNEKNKMLTRIYGLAFASKKDLISYKKKREEAKKNDHRTLGKQLHLFTFSEKVGKGLPLWTPAGAVIKREIQKFIIDTETKWGYQHVTTPDIARLDLYRTSGHYPYYKESMYQPIVIDNEEFMLRPMSCPHHFELYLSEPRSYRDLPIRYAEIARLYRYEQSGELTGLIRVRSFELADAHIFCTGVRQAEQEIERALELIEHIASVFGLKSGKDYWYRLSLRGRNNEKYHNDLKAWQEAEAALTSVLKRNKKKYISAPDEAAFYGPKIDIQMKNVYGKEDTAFTIQYDTVMPTRFNLTFRDSDGKEKQCVVVHRSSIGALERVIAFLLEHFKGSLPLWISPYHIALLPVSDKYRAATQKIGRELEAKGIRTWYDTSSSTLGKKLYAVRTKKIPYHIVIGEREAKEGKYALEGRGIKVKRRVPLAAISKRIEREIATKALPPKEVL